MADRHQPLTSPLALYALRVEGQNFKWVLYDTHDLSASAGGSRLLEMIPDKVAEVLKTEIQPADGTFEKVQSASSSAVYACCCSEDKMKTVLSALRQAFQSGNFVHLTVAVETIRVQDAACEPGALAKSIQQIHLQQLFAAVRCAQLTAPNAAVPADTKVKLACEKDHLRPKGTDQKYKWSDSVYTRRQQGKEFRLILAAADAATVPVPTARTFDGLTSLNDPNDPRNLKLAVISIDGNGFGKLIQEHCTGGALLKTFSDEMTLLQKGFEDKLLTEWLKHEGTDKEKEYFIDKLSDDRFAKKENLKPEDAEVPLLRLQRLVTAGDDAIYLMPAWLAWEFLEMFFAQTWTISNFPHPLTFRVGMVLCHHNAPIHRIRKLADQLSNLARDAAKDAPEKIDNLIAYEVLKSFNLIGPDLGKYREQRVQGKLRPDQMLLDGKILSGKLTQLRKLEEAWPAGKIKDLSAWKDQSEDAVNAFHFSQLGPYLPKSQETQPDGPLLPA